MEKGSAAAAGSGGGGGGGGKGDELQHKHQQQQQQLQRQQLSQLFPILVSHFRAACFEEAVKVADRILAVNAADFDALKVKLVCLIRLDKCDEVHKILVDSVEQPAKGQGKKGSQPGAKELSERFPYELAYSLYRLNRYPEAMDVVRRALLGTSKAQGDSVPWKYLEAQIAYRLEEYDQCVTAYEDIMKSLRTSDPLHDDIMTNFAAVRAAAAMSKRSVPIEALPKSKLETHEQLYNAACEALARDDLVNAEKHLDRAQFVCSNLSVDHFTSEEKEQELAPILVQKSYIAQMRGLDSDFAKTYQEVISSRNADEAISAVASNNLVACYGCKDLFDSAKKLRAANAEKLQHRLLRSQRATMAANLASLYLKMKKVSEARSLANRLSEQFPDSEAANLVLASCALFQKQPGKALEELAELARMRPGSVAICFARVQLLVAQGLYDQSLQVLEGAKLTSRAAVRLRIWLLEQLGRKEEVVGALKRAAEEAGEADTPASLTRELAKIKLASGRTREAVSDYERVLRNDSSDVQALAGLVVAIAAFDVAKANEYARGLPDLPLDMADAGMDVASLESIVPGAKKYYLRKAAADGGNAVELKKKKKKARKPLLPKNYDPNVLPDPERWLRKDLRTSARKKGKGRANVALKGPQGAAVGGGGVGSTGSANIHGMKSKPAPAPVSEQVSAKSDVASDAAEVTKSRGGGAAGSGGGGGGSGKNKKKGKGRR